MVLKMSKMCHKFGKKVLKKYEKRPTMGQKLGKRHVEKFLTRLSKWEQVSLHSSGNNA